jgi:hypothetical protein
MTHGCGNLVGRFCNIVSVRLILLTENGIFIKSIGGVRRNGVVKETKDKSMVDLRVCCCRLSRSLENPADCAGWRHDDRILEN